MKPIFIFLLLPFFGFSQSDKNISVISAEKMNIIYRGIENPIKIAVPGAKSFKATAKDSALVKVDSVGNYILYGRSGHETKVEIEAVMEDGSMLHEEKVFKILGIPRVEAALYRGEYCYRCTFEMSKQELIEANLTLSMPTIPFVEESDVKGFTIFLFNEKKNRHIEVIGSKMSDAAISRIRKLKKGTELLIHQIKGSITGVDMMICKMPQLKVIITD